MQRSRTIAGPPQRTATAAWETAAALICDTLAVSGLVTADTVSAALAPLRGLGPALIAAGHLETGAAVLVSGPLHVSITVATGGAVTEVQENLNPVPGGANATSDWVLYLPNPANFAVPLAAAVQQSAHLSVAAPPEEATAVAASSKAGLVDLAALGRLERS
ncbi:hypothetical protein [Actinoplanes sp. G11-F43]|uniref:hypothetical protein n=1 Tax=Actinoplanes sp. G11-F43 TaxID=3424130 RepID=UPI003D358390